MSILHFARNKRHSSPECPEQPAAPRTRLDTEKEFSETLLALETAIDTSANEMSRIAHVLIHDACAHLFHLIPESPNAEPPPTLRDVYLLAQTYDLTGNATILAALTYILNTAPPALTDELKKAHQKAIANGTPIMQEYTHILDQADTARELPRNADEVSFPQAMQAKTPPGLRNSEWDERVRQFNEKD